MIDREAAYAALFARLQTVPGFVTVSRRLRTWSDVDATEQPALFLTQGRQITLTGPDNLPTRWRLLADVFVYVKVDDPNAALPATVLNTLVNAIDAAIKPAFPGMQQTLNGVVEHCRIAGEIETDEGVLGAQAVAIIPVELYPTP